jgi:Ca2+-binding EF-hand superfamily protein
MRVQFVAGVLLVALVAFLIDPSTGQSQPPRGGGGGGRNRGGQGGGGGWGAQGGSGWGAQGGGAWGAQGGGAWGGQGGGGWGGQGGGGRGGFDPDRIFDMLAQGANTIKIANMTFGRDRVEQWAKEKGITNGELTREQYREFSQAGFGGRQGGRTGGGIPDPRGGRGGRDFDSRVEAIFNRMDKNGDGVLSYDEMSENLKAERDKWDANKDGLIDREEFKEYLKAFEAKRQADWAENGGGPPGDNRGGGGPGPEGTDQRPPSELDKKVVVLRAGKLGDAMPDWFQDYDLDGDAQVALWEWKEKGGDLAKFREWDLNGDGFITPDEVLRVLALANKDAAATGGNRSASASGQGGNRFARGGGQGPGGGQGGGGGVRGMGGGNFPGFPGGQGVGGPASPGSGDNRGGFGRSGFGRGRGGDNADNPDNPDSGQGRGRGQGRNRPGR